MSLRTRLSTAATLAFAVGFGVFGSAWESFGQTPAEGTTFTEVTYWYHAQGREDHGGHGIAFVDINGDGYPDLYVTNAVRDLELDDLFLFNENGVNFDDRTSDYKLWDPGMSHGIVAVDVDNDGDLDYFNGNTDKPCRLYINKGNYFADETFARGIQYFDGGTRGVVAFDIDNDGDMDLYAGNWGDENETYINDGTGHFTRKDVGANDPEGNDDGTQGVTTADFDNDGDMDIFVAMRGTECRLFVNDGTGHFTRGESAAGILVDAEADGGTFADIDNDGDLDLFVVKYHEYTGQTVYMNVFRNNGDGTFTDETDVHDIVYDGYMAAVGDLDNDGDLDIVTAPHKDVVKIYLNDGTGHFSRLENPGSAPYRGDPRGIALADMDLDGDLDIYIAVKDGDNVLLRNNLSNSNRWLRVAVTGWNGDYGGIGTRLYAYDAGHAGEAGHLVGFREITSASGYVGQSDLVQHFGLGLRDSVDLVARFTDGTRLVLRSVAANQTIHIRGDFARFVSSQPGFLQATGGDNQSGPFGSPLPEPLEVLVEDAEGNPLPGVAVDFAAVSGAADFSVDSLALGQPYWGEAEDARDLDSTWVGYDSTASGGHFVWLDTDDSLSLDYWSPADTTVWVWLRMQGYSESKQVWVKIGSDSVLVSHPVGSGWIWGRAQRKLHTRKGFVSLLIENDSLALWIDKWVATPDSDFVPVGFGGTNLGQPWVTDASGRLQTTVTPQPPDTQIVVQARLADPSLTASWTLHGHYTKVARVVVVSGDSQTVYVGRPSSQPLTVKAVSEGGQPVPGKTILYRVLRGEGVFTPADTAITGSDGQAAVTFTAAGDSGEAVISASAVGEEADSALFHLHVKRTPHTLVAISPTDTSTVVVDTLRLIVRILDAQGRPVPRDSVRFSVKTEQGWFAPDSARDVVMFTDTSGYALVDLLLGEHAGQGNHKVEVTSSFQGDPLDGSPLEFVVTTVADTARSLVLISGDGQTGPAGEPLPQPIVAKVQDRYGNGVANFTVGYRVTEGGGTVADTDSGSVATDSLGRVSLTWTLGTVAGVPQTLTLTAAREGRALQGSPLTVTATAEPGPPAKVVVAGGNHQQGQVSTTVPEPLQVQVVDTHGNGVPHVAVTFSVISGSGTFEGGASRQVETDSAGFAQTAFTFGTTSGYTQLDSTRVKAAVQTPDVPPALFALWPVPGPAVAVVDSGGNAQTAVVGDTLPEPLRVRLLDEYGNGVIGSAIWFAVTAGGGHFADGSVADTVLTDTLGFAQKRLVLGTVPGQLNNRAVAKSLVLGDSIVFAETALVGPAKSLVEVSGNNQSGYVGEVLPQPLVVKVSDAFGNGIESYQVIFRVHSGNAQIVGADSVRTVQTDSAGHAQVQVRLDTTATGSVVIWAEAENNGIPLDGSPVEFKAKPLAAGTAVFEIVSGNDQTGTVGQELPERLVVRLRDPYGNPHVDWPVQFRVTAGGGQVNGAPFTTVNTDSAGLASVVWTLGHTAGHWNNTVEARVDSADPQILVFRATARAGAPSHLSKLKGDAQTGYVMNRLADSLAVKLQDGYDNPTPGVHLLFEIVSGGGRLNGSAEPVTVVTDSSGLGEVAWTLGPRVGTQQVKVSVQDVSSQPQGSPAVFEARALPLAPSRVVIVRGDSQRVIVGHLAPEPLVVAVLDSVGNGVAGIPVLFRQVVGSGHLVGDGDSLEVVTDSLGQASVQYKLGTLAGKDGYVVEAVVEWNGQPVSGSPARFELTGLPTAPKLMSVVEGNHQIAAPGEPFENAFAVAALDSFLNEIPQAWVTFACNHYATWQNEDTLVSVQADSFGIARAQLKAGTAAGKVAVRAWTSGLEARPVLFRDVFVSRSEAVQLQKVAGDSQRVRAGSLVPVPLRVKAVLGSAEPAAKEVVAFAVTSGHASLLPVDWCATNADGEGSVRVRLGSQPGVVTIQARLVSGKGEPVSFRLEALPNHAPVVRVTADTTISETDSLYLPIRVSDPDGDPVSLAVSNLPPGAKLDTLGAFALLWRPSYAQSGDWPVEITASDTLGASTTVTVTIRVLNRNRAPVIVSWQPADSVVSLSRGGTLAFSVVAVDPDSDQLRVRWYLDEQLQGEGADFTVSADQLGTGRHLVSASVTDGDKSVAHHWWLDILTAVRLEAFEGVFRRNKGIELHWTVSQASEVAQYVLERKRPDGFWVEIAKVPQGAAETGSFHYVDVAPAGQSRCVYRLEAVDLSGESQELGKVTVEIPLPKQFCLHPVYPNPFNPTTNIRFDVPKPDHVRIRIFDLTGRLVRTIFDGRLQPGYHRFVWNATDEEGRGVPSGTYLIVTSWSDGRSVRKVVLLK